MYIVLNLFDIIVRCMTAFMLGVIGKSIWDRVGTDDVDLMDFDCFGNFIAFLLLCLLNFRVYGY